jgi:phosphoribosylaminoimidazole-succinocarboxamide synthase
MDDALLSVEVDGRKPDYSGKVREIFDLGDRLIIVATDRLSAFDVVFNEGIPEKGKILTEVSNIWFRMLDMVENHLIETDIDRFPAPFSDAKFLAGRAILVKKTKRIDVECVVRGYLAGSGYKDYMRSGEVSGIALPAGLKMAEKLPDSIFTPSTKAETGHDENITQKDVVDLIGRGLANKIEELSLSIYTFAHEKMREKGIILADTKFEFGIREGEVILIDEVLTPDSSRYWPLSSYAVGESPPSYDKQFVRDFLETTDWDKTPPPPKLPDHIISGTREKYREILSIVKEVSETP